MSAPGRPKREYRSAQHGGCAMSEPGDPGRRRSPYKSLCECSLAGRCIAPWVHR